MKIVRGEFLGVGEGRMLEGSEKIKSGFEYLSHFLSSRFRLVRFHFLNTNLL